MGIININFIIKKKIEFKILSESDILLPQKQFNFFNLFSQLNFRVSNGLKLLPLKFLIKWPSIVYKMTYTRQNCKYG